MLSDFLVAHPSGPFFTVSKSEFELATKKYPELLSNTNLEFMEHSATTGVIIGQDGYFDNTTILQQFERLFQLLQFKKQFEGHDIEVVVDNARTHSAKEYSVNDFGKRVGTRCPVDFIEFLDQQANNIKISCYFASGEHIGKSKGLLNLARELQIQVQDTIKLNELREILGKHPAFQNVNTCLLTRALSEYFFF